MVLFFARALLTPFDGTSITRVEETTPPALRFSKQLQFCPDLLQMQISHAEANTLPSLFCHKRDLAVALISSERYFLQLHKLEAF